MVPPTPRKQTYGLRDYAAKVASAGLVYCAHPIVEMAAPDDAHRCYTFIDDLCCRLRAGECVLLHCRGGVGRAGLVAACMLLRLGLAADSDAAIAEVRRRRCRTAVETCRQEHFVRQYAALLASAAAAL